MDFTYQPLFSKTPRSIAPFKIIPASHVTPDSGTGLVHCAPAHGAEDYSSFQTLGLLRAQDPSALVCHVNGEGCFSRSVIDVVGSEIGDKLQGTDVLVSGTNLIIEALKEMGDVLVTEEPIKHRYPYDWKTNKPIIVTYASPLIHCFKDTYIYDLPVQLRNGSRAWTLSRRMR